jgi:hypothetical protein
MIRVSHPSGHLEATKEVIDEPEPEVVIVVEFVILLATQSEVKLGRHALRSLVGMLDLLDVLGQCTPESLASLITPSDELVRQLRAVGKQELPSVPRSLSGRPISSSSYLDRTQVYNDHRFQRRSGAFVLFLARHDHRDRHRKTSDVVGYVHHLCPRDMRDNGGSVHGRGVLRGDRAMNGLGRGRVPGGDQVGTPFYSWLEGDNRVRNGERLRLRDLHLMDPGEDGLGLGLSRVSLALGSMLWHTWEEMAHDLVRLF